MGALGNGDGQNSLAKYQNFANSNNAFEIISGWQNNHTTNIQFLNANGYDYHLIETGDKPLNQTEVGRTLIPYLWKFRGYGNSVHGGTSRTRLNIANRNFNNQDGKLIRSIKAMDFGGFNGVSGDENYRGSTYLPLFYHVSDLTGTDLFRNPIEGVEETTFPTTDTPKRTKLVRGLKANIPGGTNLSESVQHDFGYAEGWDPASSFQYVYSNGKQVGCMFGLLISYIFDCEYREPIKVSGSSIYNAQRLYKTTQKVTYAGFSDPFGFEPSYYFINPKRLEDLYGGETGQGFGVETVMFGDFPILKTTHYLTYTGTSLRSAGKIGSRDLFGGEFKGGSGVSEFTASANFLTPTFF